MRNDLLSTLDRAEERLTLSVPDVAFLPASSKFRKGLGWVSESNVFLFLLVDENMASAVKFPVDKCNGT